jgi:hypothetical protein
MKYLQKLEDEVAQWPGTSIHPHRFGGREFLLGKAEVGHVHSNAVVDIPFPRPIHDALLDEGLAEEHHWVPDSGWTTFRVRAEDDLAHAYWLLRLSYLRYALKQDADPLVRFERESEALRLSPRFRGLLAVYVQQPMMGRSG